MNVIWAARAYDDLDRIADYLGNLDDEAAERTLDRIQAAIRRIGEFPNIGSKVDQTGLRRLVVSHTSYVIFYRVVGDCVSIRGLFHASQRRFLE